METQERDFKGVWIPKVVWLDGRLNALEKVILTEIDSLDQGERGCWASNKHIAEFCQCSETKVSTAISKLIKFGYLYVKNFDGRQRELKSCLSNFETLHIKKCESDIQNLKQSNTESNTSNNTSKQKKGSKESLKSFDEIIDEYTEDIELRGTLIEFMKMRQRIRKPMTNYAFELMLKKLDKLGNTPKLKISILNQSIVNSWQDVYPIKNGGTRKAQTTDNMYYMPNQSAANDDSEDFMKMLFPEGAK